MCAFTSSINSLCALVNVLCSFRLNQYHTWVNLRRTEPIPSSDCDSACKMTGWKWGDGTDFNWSYGPGNVAKNVFSNECVELTKDRGSVGSERILNSRDCEISRNCVCEWPSP